jgi:hypothetical protein
MWSFGSEKDNNECLFDHRDKIPVEYAEHSCIVAMHTNCCCTTISHEL